MVTWSDVQTGLTTVVAVASPITAAIAYRAGRRRERENQARKVFIACFPSGDPPVRTAHPDLNIESFEIRVWNLSDAPVVDVALIFSSPVGSLKVEELMQSGGMPRRRFLEAGETFDQKFTMLMHTQYYTLDDLYARVIFTDTAGRTWLRLRNGELYAKDEHIPHKMYNFAVAQPPSSLERIMPRSILRKIRLRTRMKTLAESAESNARKQLM